MWLGPKAFPRPRSGGSPLRGLPLLALALAAASSGALIAQANLLPNGNFDSDISGWAIETWGGDPFDGPPMISWDTKDAADSPTSGSMRLFYQTYNYQGSANAKMCLPIEGGATYELQGLVHNVGYLDTDAAQASVKMESYTDAACQTGRRFVASDVNVWGTWKPVLLTSTLERGAHSLLITIDARKCYICTGGTLPYAFRVWVDSLSLRKTAEAPLLYVALGDSYASGEGAGQYAVDYDGDGTPDENTDQANNRCHRSANAYSLITYAIDLSASEFYACSGAESEDLLDSPQDKAPAEPPQLDHLDPLAPADLVTVSIGGNDVGFADVVLWCYVEDDCPSYTPPGWSMTLGDWLPRYIAILGPRIELTLAELRNRAPAAAIYVMGYPVPFPTGDPGAPGGDPQLCNALESPDDLPFVQRSLEPGEQDWLRSMAPLLNGMIRNAARSVGAVFIDVNKNGLFSGHEICGPLGSWFVEPSLARRNSPEVVHPNATGHREGFRRALEAALVAGELGIGAAQPSAASIGQLRAKVERLEAALPSLGELQVKLETTTCSGKIVAVPGQSLRLAAEGFSPASLVTLSLESGISSRTLGTVTAATDGHFDITRVLPLDLPASSLWRALAAGQGSNGLPRTAVGWLNIGPPTGQDSDGDTVADACDVCPHSYDPAQQDSDGDGVGDLCDPCPFDSENDADGDGLCANEDPCSSDRTNDGDGDGLCAAVDNCPLVANAGQQDSDSDLIGDACDECPDGANVFCLHADGFESGGTDKWTTVP